MAKTIPKPKPQLLRWSDYVPASDVTDPLGLGLRGSTRLASLLLYCITSITPRARYFSFIPWCIRNFQEHEKDKKYALGLKEAIKLREKALTYGCVAHHGQPCDGGALVGSTAAQKWLATNNSEVNLKSVPFAKNPALNAYLNSLVNLGFFVEQDAREETDEELDEGGFTFENIELSALGKELAESYDSVVRKLGAVKAVSESERSCSLSTLKELGKRGGLCELADPSAPDRTHLRDVFFARKGLTEKSHFRRNRSLVLILELCRQLSAEGWNTNGFTFGSSVYFGQISDDGESLQVSVPDLLLDIATRWRMFYFHHYMGVALEGIFSWVVTQLSDRGLTGASVAELSAELKSPLVSRVVRELIDQSIPEDFGSSSPAAFFSTIGIPESNLTVEVSRAIDKTVKADNAGSETRLEDAIRDGKYRQSPAGLAIPCILFALTLARYKQWEETEYGIWLASDAVVKDSYLDLLPSTVLLGLARHHTDWWTRPWTTLAEYILSRFVVQQHQSMAYEKTAAGDRCLLEVDGDRVISDSVFDKIGLGNPRLNSAIQILTDLALLTEDDDGIFHLTADGLKLLKTELKREAEA